MMLIYSCLCMIAVFQIIEKTKQKKLFLAKTRMCQKQQPPKVIKIRLLFNRTIHTLNRFCFSVVLFQYTVDV